MRLFGPTADGRGRATVAQDLEPEYIAVSADGKTAWVTLQENNALAIVDIAKAAVTDIVALGYKGPRRGRQRPRLCRQRRQEPRDQHHHRPNVLGMYQPDAIAAYQAGDGQTYLVSANEGDARAWGEGTPAYFGNGAKALAM